jgi:hypothetical protein
MYHLTTAPSTSSQALTTNALNLLSYQPPQPPQPTKYIYIYIYIHICIYLPLEWRGTGIMWETSPLLLAYDGSHFVPLIYHLKKSIISVRRVLRCACIVCVCVSVSVSVCVCV